MTQRLGLVQRSFVRLLRAMTRLAAGYDMGVIAEDLVRTHGMRGALRILKMGADVIERLNASFGESTAQLLIGVAAMWNGCRYCVIGHIYSANLFTFRDHKRLGPLDEAELVGLMKMTDEELLAVLRERFAGAEHSRTWYLLERMFQLRFRDLVPVLPEDDLLKATMAYWEWLNECTIILGVDAEYASVPALGYARPGKELVTEYAAARAAARGGAAAAPAG